MSVLVDPVPALTDVAGTVGEDFVIDRPVADDGLHFDRALGGFAHDRPPFRIVFLNGGEIFPDEIGVTLFLKATPVEPGARILRIFCHLRRNCFGERLIRSVPGPVQPGEVSVVGGFEESAERRDRLFGVIERQLPFVVDAPDEDVVMLPLPGEDGVNRRRGGVEDVFTGVRVEETDLLVAVFHAGVIDRMLDRPVVFRLRRIENGVRGPDVEEAQPFAVGAFPVVALRTVLEFVTTVCDFTQIKPRERQQPERVVTPNPDREEIPRWNQFRRKLGRKSVGLLQRIERERRRDGRHGGPGQSAFPFPVHHLPSP